MGTQEPDPTNCQTAEIGAVLPGTSREMYYCKIDNADCKFAMPFGFDYICQHLNNHGFSVPNDEKLGMVIGIFLANSTERFTRR